LRQAKDQFEQHLEHSKGRLQLDDSMLLRIGNMIHILGNLSYTQKSLDKSLDSRYYSAIDEESQTGYSPCLFYMEEAARYAAQKSCGIGSPLEKMHRRIVDEALEQNDLLKALEHMRDIIETYEMMFDCLTDLQIEDLLGMYQKALAINWKLPSGVRENTWITTEVVLRSNSLAGCEQVILNRFGEVERWIKSVE